MGTGHFTAMVWKATRRLGCAKGNCPGQNLWVCQYDPPGNMMGAFPQNVPPPLWALPAVWKANAKRATSFCT